MPKHIYLSDVVSDRASVLFRFSIRDLIPISGRVCNGFWEHEDDLMAKYPELFAGQP
jgi:hypothetical protein